MTLNRLWKSVTIHSFASTVDEYGQRRQGVTTTRTIEMVPKIYSQSNIETPKYVDVELLGITKDSQITTENEVEIDSVKYLVLYVIPSGKYYQILMRKK